MLSWPRTSQLFYICTIWNATTNKQMYVCLDINTDVFSCTATWLDLRSYRYPDSKNAPYFYLYHALPTDVLTVQRSQWRGKLGLLQYDDQFEWDTLQRQWYRQKGDSHNMCLKLPCIEQLLTYVACGAIYTYLQDRIWKNPPPAFALKGMPTSDTEEQGRKVQSLLLVALY